MYAMYSKVSRSTKIFVKILAPSQNMTHAKYFFCNAQALQRF